MVWPCTCRSAGVGLIADPVNSKNINGTKDQSHGLTMFGSENCNPAYFFVVSLSGTESIFD